MFAGTTADLNELNRRFKAPKWQSEPRALKDFPSANETIRLTGKTAFWEIESSREGTPALRLLHVLEPDRNPQSACFFDDNLAIASSDRVMIYGPGFEPLEPIIDPWIAGTHTVRHDGKGSLWVTSAPANAALRVDTRTRRVIERLRMPDTYGHGLPLRPEDNLREHFLPTDYQPTHLNSAEPVGEGVLVTLWIPGVVGYFDKERNYTEIARGLRGCHGARVHPETGEIYVSDSPTGLIWFFDPENFRVTRRIDFRSKWLHDAIFLGDGYFLGMLSDKNSIVVLNQESGDITQEVSCDALGRSTLFVNLDEPSAAWRDFLRAGESDVESAARFKTPEAIDILTPTIRSGHAASAHVGIQERVRLSHQNPLSFEYLYLGDEWELPAGRYRLEVSCECKVGGVSIGLLDIENDSWLVSCECEARRSTDWRDFATDTPKSVRLVIAAHNPDGESPVDCEVKNVGYRIRA